MLSNFTKTINLNAMSVVKNEGGTYDVILGIAASIKEDGTWGVTQSVHNQALYEANMEQADTDFSEFKSKVVELARTYKDDGQAEDI